MWHAIPSNTAFTALLLGNVLSVPKDFTQVEEFALSVQSIVSNALKPMDVQHAKTLIIRKINYVRPALLSNTASLVILKDNAQDAIKDSSQAVVSALSAQNIARIVLKPMAVLHAMTNTS